MFIISFLFIYQVCSIGFQARVLKYGTGVLVQHEHQVRSIKHWPKHTNTSEMQVPNSKYLWYSKGISVPLPPSRFFNSKKSNVA